MVTNNSGGAGGRSQLVDRRLALKTLATGAVVVNGACSAPDAPSPPERPPVVTPLAHDIVLAHAQENPIRIENRKRGTDAFLLKKPATAGECEVYCSVTSAEAGETVDVFA